MSRKKKPVIAIGIDGSRREYDSVWEAHEDGFHYPKIYRCLKRHSQTHRGYHWRRPAEGKQAEPPNLEEALAWIAEATKVFAELAGGGPDLFTRRGDDFRADVHICRSRILSALISSPGERPNDWVFEAIRAGYERGAMWHHENGSLELVEKASYDFADKMTAPSSPGNDGGQEVEAVGEAAELARLRAIALDMQAGYVEATERAEEAVKAANALQTEVDLLRSTIDEPASTALVERLTKALDGLNVQYGAPDGISINEATRAAAKGIIRFALSANEDAELLHGMGSDAEFLRDLADRLRSIPVMHGTTGFDIDVLHDMARRLSPDALSASHTSREGER